MKNNIVTTIESYFSSNDERVSRTLLILSLISSIIYFFILFMWFPIRNPWIFGVLMFGQLFYFWQGINYIYTVWDTTYRAPFDALFKPPVDVFITVAGEPLEIVEETVRAAYEMDYPNFKIYILNDGFVAKKDNWEEMEILAKEYAPVCTCITRRKPGGAKAGNINNALTVSKNPYIVIFDADHVPHKDFLKKTMGYFGDKKVGFVQTPQYYKNFGTNDITRGAWEQQEIYYGAICRGRNRLGCVTMCGTNMVVNREALVQVGGMCDFNIAEDFITGMFMHERGWISVYVSEVLAQGLAPEDFISYYKQQLRWARGSLEVLFKFNPVIRWKLRPRLMQLYVASSGYYLSGLVTVINALLPLIFFFTKTVPFSVSTMALALAFIPYMFFMMYTIQQSTRYAYTFHALAFSMGSFMIHIQALLGIFLGKKASFAITSKTKLTGNFFFFALPHLLYVVVVFSGITVAFLRDGVTPALITNSAWAFLNIIIFSPFIAAAISESPPEILLAKPSVKRKLVTRHKEIPTYAYANLKK